MRRVSLAAVTLLVIAFGVVSLVAWRHAHAGLPRRSGQIVLAGLERRVEVSWSPLGVPHIQAASLHDAALVLGYLHANDRITQMELGRRLTSGRLAALVGKVALPSDRYYRSIGMLRWAQRQLSGLSPSSLAILHAYSDGVNAWLRERDGDLPPDLWLLGADPEPWRPIDSIYLQLAMAHDLSFWQGRPEEVRFRWLRAIGADALGELLGVEPLQVPEPIARLAAAPSPTDKQATSPAAWEPRTLRPQRFASPGSNNWALGPSLTADGDPILANDPHLPLRLPGVWYQVLVRCPQYEASGLTLPGLPYVVIGQGRRVAWGLTNVMLDDHDLFFEHLSDDGQTVQRGDAWEAIEITREIIDVAGSEPVAINVRYTDLGALLDADPDRGLPARSLAWTAEYAADPGATFLALARARSVKALTGSLEQYVVPAQNLVAADHDGGVLYTALGRVPARRTGDGRLPTPGWDPAYGWDGLVPQTANPTRWQPAGDLVVTANNDILPPGFTFPVPFTADFDTPHRATRIEQLLRRRHDWRLADMASVQTDVRSLYAAELLGQIDGEYEGKAATAMAILRGWDQHMAVRGPSALFAWTQRRLASAIFDDEAEAYGLPSIAGRAALLRVLRGDMSPGWFDDRRTGTSHTRRQILAAALADAYDDVVERWGPDPADWQYGAVHSLRFENPVGRVPLVGRWLNRGPIPMPGSATTVAAFGGVWRDGKVPVAYGPSMRWLADPVEPDRSLVVLPLGQSGHPADPHYDDQLPLYLSGRLHPVYWSSERIQAMAASTMTLVPADSR